jgi:hypothetical protein
MRKLITLLLFLVPTLCFAQPELPKEGYFWTTPVVEEVQIPVLVVIGEEEVPILDEEGNPTGETYMRPILEEQVQTTHVTKICGEVVRNWVVCGYYDAGAGPVPIISVLMNTDADIEPVLRLKAHADFLGTPKQILQAAKDGNVKARKVIRNATYTLISDGEGGLKRVTMQEWIDLGRPVKHDKFRPYHRWFLDPEVAEDDEV